MQFPKFNLRLRWRTRLFVLCAMVIWLGGGQLAAAKASGKSPQDGGEYGSDIIEQPLQEDRVESGERHRAQSEEEESTEARDLKPALIAKNHIGQEMENHTQETSEEYYDETSARDILKNLMRNIVTTKGPKAARNPYENVAITESDATTDYSGEEVGSSDKFNERTKNARRKKTFVELPRPATVDGNNDDDNDENINRRQQEQHFLRKQKQLLPNRQPAPNFSAQARYDDGSQYEQYDDDDNDEEDEDDTTPLKRKDEIPVSYANKVMHQQRKAVPLPVVSDVQWQLAAAAAAEPDELKDETGITFTPVGQSPAITRPTTNNNEAVAKTTTAKSTALPVPKIPYGSTIPTQLSEGAFEPITEFATGLQTTPETHVVAPATTKTTTTTTTTTTNPSKATKTQTKIKTKPTTTRPGGKQGKQINILRRKLQPHEKLRNYVEDAYIRMPLAVIVDPSSESLEKTKALWRDALRTNFNIKIVLVSLNGSGVPAAYSFNNTKQFLAGLNSIKEHDGGDAFIGIVHASELVPYDSAVFISTAVLPPHTELVQDAAITLLKKRIRLYLIWFGERSLSENETQESVGGILGEVAIRSGGDILHIVGSENSQELEVGNTLVLVADAFRGAQEIEIPVDTTLSSLHVKIDAPTRTVTLETPNGDLNLKKMFKLNQNVLTMGPPHNRLDAFVPLTKLRKQNTLILRIVPESLAKEYNVFIRADRKADHFLEDIIKRFDDYFMEGFPNKSLRFRENRLQSITNALATPISTHEDLKFPENNDNITNNRKEPVENDDVINDDDKTAPKSEVETFSATEIYKNPNGTEIGESVNMSRAFESQQQLARNPFQMSITKIEMSAQSQLLVAPGTASQLVFEVTNTRSESVYHNIQVVDERKFLQTLIPQNVLLRPGETATVTLTVFVPQGTSQGTTDRITFTCHGSGTASLSLNLKVVTSIDAQDTVPPIVTWNFGSRCEYIAADSPNCAERFWTLDITAQDWETGILRLQSTPTNRLYYRNSYTVGSTEPLKATYTATCCEPKVSLLAYDVAGNQRSHNIDVRDIILTEATIAAIVLGALLLLLLLILLIWGIVYCCRRRKITLDLPTYRSHSTRSME